MAVARTQSGYLADKHQASLLALVNVNEADVATNVTNVATNVTNIATNVTNVATNVTNIAANVTRLDAIEQDLKSVRVQLSAAEVKALAAANIELLAAPAAGLAHVPVAIHFFMAHGGTDFVQVNDTDALALKWNGGAEITEVASEALMTALLEATGDKGLYATLEVDLHPVAAAAIDLDNNGAAEITTGNGTLSVELFYRTVTMAAFS